MLQEVLDHQFEASLCMLNACIDRCPDASWHDPVANLRISQVCFHVLFFVDYYLGESDDGFLQQEYHAAKKEFFGDYEEMQDRPQQRLYEKIDIKDYLQHCRDKARAAFAAESDDELALPCKFPRRNFSRAELHVYNLRHLQHHVAQLSLRLRLDHDIDVPWVGIGWKELE